MKNIITVMLLMCFTCISAQNTILVIDNQNPGWLSNKIPFKDQESVKNLTVTGYLNGTDIKFLNELFDRRQLTHLDLTDSYIVAGGDTYYSNYTTKDNELTPHMFYSSSITPKTIDFLATPKSTVKEDKFLASNFYVDTLIVGGKSKSFKPRSVYDGFMKVTRLVIREGIESVFGDSNGSSSMMAKLKSVDLPTTVKEIGYQAFCGCKDLKEIRLSDNIESIGEMAFSGTEILSFDSLIIPSKLKKLYFNSFPMHRIKYIKIPIGVEKISNSKESVYSSGEIITPSMKIEIHTKNPTPIWISSTDTSDEKNLKSCTVYVPKGSLEDYKNEHYFSNTSRNVWSYATILEEKVPVTGITLDQENISFSDIGASVQLTATILPTDADNQKVIWKSSDTNVATVKDGKVTCTGYGTAIITATSEEGEYIATCNVTATKRIVLPSSITLDRNEATIKVGEATTLKANVLPADADDKTIVWSSENSDIASVTNDGVVTGHKAGTTKIIVTTNANGLKDECMLTVLQPATGIVLDRQNISFANIGETVQLTANVLPENASNKNVSWASSDTKVAIVSNGKVVCTGYGTAVISAVSEDGGYMATCIITANKNVILPSSITLDKSNATINVGESFTLNANVLPDNADNKIIVWNSDDADIASVNNEGEVTGIKAGTTKIIAMTQANDLKAECLITVLQPVTGITLDRNDIYFVEIGESVQLIANVLPEDASNKNVVWTSSDANVATVNDGVVVCMGDGSAVITASTEDGGYKAICVINATSGIAGVNDSKAYTEIKRYDATGREIKNPVNGLNIIKTQDGRVIKTTVRIK